MPAAPVLSGTYITPETALGLAAVFSAVNVISRDWAGLPRNVVRKLPGGGRVVDETHPVHRLVHSTPNGEVDAYRYFQSAMSHVLTRGNSYSEIVRGDDGTPESLHLLHPSKTTPKRTPGGRLFYELDDGAGNSAGKPIALWADDVLHFAGMGFNGIQGYSPVTVARQTIGLGVAVEQYGAAFFGNAAVPKGVLKTARKLTEAAVNNLRRTINQVHQGSQSAHQLMILEEGLEWVQTQFSPEDGQFLLTREFQVKEVARLFNLPPHKVGDYSESHLANVEEANLDYLTMTLYGWVVMGEAQMNSKLLTREDRRTHEIVIDMSALMRGNSAARTAYYQGMRNMGCLSADDIRAAEGLNPIGKAAGGQLYIVQGQYLPLGQIGKQPAAPPAPAAPPPPAPDQADAEADSRALPATRDHAAFPTPCEYPATIGGFRSYLIDCESHALLSDASPVVLDYDDFALRYNHCHGPDGRFCSGGKGGKGATGSFTPLALKPGGGKGGGGGGGGGGAPAAPAKAPAAPAKAPAAAPKAKKPPVDFGDPGLNEHSDAFKKQVAATHDRLSAGWRKGLDVKEKAAIRNYTGSNYDEINGRLRSGGPHDWQVKQLDEALSKTALTDEIVVYRGIKNAEKLGLHPTKSLGDVIRDPAYLSTSLNPAVAKSFAGPEGGKGAVLRITAPPGTKGASVARLTEFPHEHEVLFSRGSGVKITHVSHEGGRPIYHGVLVQ